MACCCSVWLLSSGWGNDRAGQCCQGSRQVTCLTQGNVHRLSGAQYLERSSDRSSAQLERLWVHDPTTCSTSSWWGAASVLV